MHPWQFANKGFHNKQGAMERTACEVSGVDDGVGIDAGDMRGKPFLLLARSDFRVSVKLRRGHGLVPNMTRFSENDGRLTEWLRKVMR